MTRTLLTNRVGCLVWWSASAIQADPAALREAVRLHSPEHVKLVRDPVDPCIALTRATRRVRAPGLRWEVVADDVNGVTAALVRIDISGHSYTADTIATTGCPRPGGSAQATVLRLDGVPQNQEMVRRLQERWDIERGCLTAQDVRLLLVEAIRDARGTRLREQGGIYLVPAPYDESIARLAEAMPVSGVDVATISVRRDDAGQLVAGAEAGLLAEAEALTAECARRLEEVHAGKETRATTIVARIAEAEELRGKAMLYQLAMEIPIARIEAAVVEATRLLRETEQALLARVSA